jgi:hypothetical protein
LDGGPQGRARFGLQRVWPPRHSMDPRVVLACWRIKGASSRKQNLEPGCETSLVRRHIALDRTAKRGSLQLQGLAVAIGCVEDSHPGQRKSSTNSIRACCSGLRGQ